MNSISTNQEILLAGNSSFFKRERAELNPDKNNKRLSQKEQLIQQCWNGLMREMIPEISETGSDKKPLTLWEVNELDHLIDLRYGEHNGFINDEWSINPYVFASLYCVN